MSLLAGAAAELAGVAAAFDEAALDPVVDAIAGARRVMAYGCGREGLMMRALAMRLFHLGVDVSMQGDKILAQPWDVLRIALPLLVYFGVIFVSSFLLSRKLGFTYEETAALSFTAAEIGRAHV